MNNKKLLLRLLKSFRGREMAGEITEAAESRDYFKLAGEAHKMKGVAANLGLKGLVSVLIGIEGNAKAGQDASELIPILDAATEETMRLIDKFVEREGD
ncbi:MAG: Hpt domain-containing protein [Defluviitaleaceae bacterium]|nr:Hpt domain-containing protein [Defluviitaleaceae bacterium]